MPCRAENDLAGAISQRRTWLANPNFAHECSSSGNKCYAKIYGPVTVLSECQKRSGMSVGSPSTLAADGSTASTGMDCRPWASISFGDRWAPDALLLEALTANPNDGPSFSKIVRTSFCVNSGAIMFNVQWSMYHQDHWTPSMVSSFNVELDASVNEFGRPRYPQPNWRGFR